MNVLCVVAHPDDEVLGCGGTLAKHAEAGDSVFLRVLSSRSDDLTKACCRAWGVLKLHENHSGQFAKPSRETPMIVYGKDLVDQQFDMEPLQKIVSLIEDHSPAADVVYTHNPGDLNLDHALVARAVLTAFRPQVTHASIYGMEVLSSTEFGIDTFQPNHWEILTPEQVLKKADALDCYPSEVKPKPHPRNAAGIYTQAAHRGMQVCSLYAEAFRTLRTIR